MEGGDVDKSYVHCRLCLVEGGSACRGRASPRTTWSFECMFVWFYDKMTINHGTHDDCFKTELFSWWYICINRICINRRLIGTPFKLIVIARHLLLKRLSPLIRSCSKHIFPTVVNRMCRNCLVYSVDCELLTTYQIWKPNFDVEASQFDFGQ